MFPLLLAQVTASVTAWPSSALILHIGLGFFLGAIGQAARMIVGLKKTGDEARASGGSFRDRFDGNQLVVSLVVGGVAGALASLALLDRIGDMNHKEILIGLIGSGYAGADFIEGFMRDEAAIAKTSAAAAPATGRSADPVVPMSRPQKP